MLKTLEVGKNSLLQIVPSMNYTRTQERIPLRCRLVGSDDEGFDK
jgi:multidrug resistance efflux pump